MFFKNPKQKNLLYGNEFIIALIVSAIFFLSFFLLCASSFASDDNVFVLYLLGGGFGNPPTHLLQYGNDWHPLLFWPVARLFSLVPSFNWYSLLLTSIQFVANAFVCYIIILKFGLKKGKWIYVLLFLFFIVPFLRSLNHSNTSFLATVSGCSGILMWCMDAPGSANRKSLLFVAFSLIFMGLMLRMHSSALVLGLSLFTGMMALPFKQYYKFLKLQLVPGAMILFLFTTQQKLYHSVIPDYRQKEQFRQSLFYHSNRPVHDVIEDTGIQKIQNTFIRNWLFYDTVFTSHNDIEMFNKKAVYSRLKDKKSLHFYFYWLVQNSRVYWLLLSGVGCCLFAFGGFKTVSRWLLACSPGFAIIIMLGLFFKITEGIFITVLSTCFLSAVFLVPTYQITKPLFNKAGVAVIMLSVIWIGKRIRDENRIHKAGIATTVCQLKEICSRPSYLFVSTGTNPNLMYFPLWHVPQQFPLPNLVYKDLVVNSYLSETFKRFQVKNLMQEIPVKKSILLVGLDQSLPDYYGQYKKVTITWVKIPDFRCLDVYRISSVNQ